MTNKTEDKFYFGKPGQPERFGYSYRPVNILASDLDHAISEIQKDMKQMTQVMQKAVKKNPLDTGWIWDTNAYANRLLNFLDEARGVLKHKDSRVQAKAKKAVAEVRAFIDKWDKMEERARSGKAPFSRPGQPDKFDASNFPGMRPPKAKYRIGAQVAVDYKGETVRGTIDSLISESPEAYMIAISGKNVRVKRLLSEITQHFPTQNWLGQPMSRPGSPDKFDASSLNRGDFSEASTSPMLGKLLAAKVMPEGGWRAVQVGSDTLVISFEDADLASDFGRRVATKGYNATSPVQAIGRYWNVEVKNGK